MSVEPTPPGPGYDPDDWFDTGNPPCESDETIAPGAGYLALWVAFVVALITLILGAGEAVLNWTW